MTTPTAPDLDDHDAELTRLLTDRAGAIEVLGTTPARLERRAARVRHRRRATVAGVGLTASAVVAAFAVTRPGDVGERIETGVADGATAAPDGSIDVRPGQLTFPPVVPDEAPPASGPAVRLGLDVPGAVVTSAGEFVGGAIGAVPTGTAVVFGGQDAERWIRVSAVFPNGAVMGDDFSDLLYPPAEQVDLGDGINATLTRPTLTIEGPEVPGRPAPDISLVFDEGGARLHVSGAGVTDDEIIGAARAIEIAANPALLVGWMPDDLVAMEPTSPILTGGFGATSSVAYDVPGGLSVSVKVWSDGGEVFDDDLRFTRLAPTEGQFLRTVRGADAIVRRAVGMTSVLWREPRGHLVEVYISPSAGNPDPSAPPDEAIVDAIVELDEVTFQELVAEHPVVTTPHP